MRRAKYGHLTLPGVFSGKVIPDIDFTDQVEVQCSSGKNTFVDDVDIQIITNKF